jgi:glycosyltransferase involved in cell wall biosynthesis
MKISILTPNFSNNCFGRAWLLASLLRSNFDVEVVGPAYGNNIWQPLNNRLDFEVKIVEGFPSGKFELKKMLKLISGEIIYASKPLIPSFGVGLVRKIRHRSTIILDIDDWELGYGGDFVKNLNWPQKVYDCLLSINNWRSYYHNFALDNLINFADGITVSGEILQKKYGGIIIWHCRDTTVFDPKIYSKKDLRGKYLDKKFRNKQIYSFIGTPRPHKGLEELIQSAKIVKQENISLMIIGDGKDEYCNHLRNLIKQYNLENEVIWFEEQPFEKIPEFLAISDIIVVPQKNRPAAIGQVPAKIFDAMAMAKPIVATKMPEYKKILADCGKFVEAESPKAIADGVRWLAKNSDKAAELGKNARKRCYRKYSWNQMENRLASYFFELEGKKCGN